MSHHNMVGHRVALHQRAAKHLSFEWSHEVLDTDATLE